MPAPPASPPPADPGIPAGLAGIDAVAIAAEQMLTVGLSAIHTLVAGETAIWSSGSVVATLPASTVGADCKIVNQGSGAITAHPPSGTLTSIAGATGDLTVGTHTSASFESDGTNWYQTG